MLETPLVSERMRTALCMSSQLMEHPAFQDMAESRIEQAEEDLASDEALEEFMLRTLGPSAHISCTCKMGPPSDLMSVVDQYGNVHRLSGLKITDASIFPTQPRCATNGPTMMTAKHMADMIKDGR